jgi:predicted peptidase
VCAALETGFVPKSIEFKDQTYHYAVWVPPDYRPEVSWPVFLYLHGKGECGIDGAFHTTVGLGKAIRENPRRFGALVVMPQMPVGCKWEGSMLDLALATLDATLDEYPTDPKRIVLTGLSLGGYGTWSLGARQTGRFSALLPICGGGNPADAERLAQLPVWCFHGDADSVIPVERSREMVEAVRAAGGDVRYTELPGVEHNSWDPAYGDPDVISWMLAQRR